MAEVHTNRFGRKPGRGLRPWLLLPKTVAVCLYIGGLAAALVHWLTSGFMSLDAIDPRRQMIVDQIGRLFVFLVVPALILTLGFGAALLLQHPRVFIRMRWLIVKLLILANTIPAGHLFLSSRLSMLREASAARVPDDAVAWQFTCGLAAVLGLSILVAVLGRLKPRLGQNWARSYRPDDTTQKNEPGTCIRKR